MFSFFLRFKRGIGLLYLMHSWIGFEEALNRLFAVKGTMVLVTVFPASIFSGGSRVVSLHSELNVMKKHFAIPLSSLVAHENKLTQKDSQVISKNQSNEFCTE